MEQKRSARLNRRYRRDLINRISGSRTVWLLTTRSLDGTANIGLFSQVVHVGANPPMMGILFRPKTDRHQSLENIEETQFFGLHAVTADRWQNAHATSFAFGASQSEFDECGWKEERCREATFPLSKIHWPASCSNQKRSSRFAPINAEWWWVRSDRSRSEKISWTVTSCLGLRAG